MKIKYDVDNNCVSCPQGCIHCGRGNYMVPIAVQCEYCGEDQEEVYDTPDGYYCKECLTEAFSKVTVDDIAEDVGEYFDEDWIERK